MGHLSVLHLYLLGFCICFTSGCLLEGYFEMSVMERFVQSKYVVYGKTVNHRANRVPADGKSVYIIDAIFEVLCVLKSWDDEVAETITVTGIAPRDDCSGTLVHSIMRVGEHAIIALTKSTDGTYTFDEIMPKTSAAVKADKPYLFSFSKICSMQTWEPPVGANTNKCPICGFADFEPEVQNRNNSDNLLTNCLSTQNAVVSNMTHCDLYMEYSIQEANVKTCIPVSYSQTCTTLLYRTSDATCDCNPKKKNVVLGVGAAQTILPNAFMAFVVLSALLKNMDL